MTNATSSIVASLVLSLSLAACDTDVSRLSPRANTEASVAASSGGPIEKPLVDPAPFGYQVLRAAALNNRDVVAAYACCSAQAGTRTIWMVGAFSDHVRTVAEFAPFKDLGLLLRDISDRNIVLASRTPGIATTTIMLRYHPTGRVDSLRVLALRFPSKAKINTNGLVATGAYRGEGRPAMEAVLWRPNGEVVSVLDVAGLDPSWYDQSTLAADVNDQGDVLITTSGEISGRSLIWNRDEGIVAQLDFEADALNENRQVIGRSSGAEASTPHYWSRRTGSVQLPFEPVAITDAGDVVGNDGAGVHVWSRSKGDRLLIPGGRAIDANNERIILGENAAGVTVVWTY